MPVVAARWEVAARPSPASPTPNPSPIGRGVAAHREGAARQGNAVFYAGKHRFLRKKTLFSLW